MADKIHPESIYEMLVTANSNLIEENATLRAENARLKAALKGMVELWDANNPNDKCACMTTTPDHPSYDIPDCELCIARAALSGAPGQ